MRGSPVFLMAMMALLGVAAFAQVRSPTPAQPAHDVFNSPYYVKNVLLNRIVSTARGYRLEYFTAKMEPVAIHVPIEWFSRQNQYGRLEDGGVKAEIYFGTDPAYPYVSIFWKNGKFSHLRIFVQENFHHHSWGTLPPGTNIDHRFVPDQEPVFRF